MELNTQIERFKAEAMKVLPNSEGHTVRPKTSATNPKAASNKGRTGGRPTSWRGRSKM